MDRDDIAIAMIESLFEGILELGARDGNESKLVQGEDFRMRGDYYDFDLGSDLYAEHGTFKLWHLRTVIRDIVSLWLRFNLRECIFSYRSKGLILLQGHLRNPSLGPAPRQIAPDPFYESTFGGTAKCFSYGPTVSYEILALIAWETLNYGWNKMVANQQSDLELYLQEDHYSYSKDNVRFEVQAVRPGEFLLEYLLQAAAVTASFGRFFDPRAMKFVIGSGEKANVAGFLAKTGHGPILDTNRTATQ